MSTSHSQIVIIGGGLTGLSLGQGLKRANIPFRIYERDTSASVRAQGYRIRIDPSGAGALKHLLPEHIWNAFRATCAPAIPGGNRLDAKTGEEAVLGKGGPPPPPTHGGTQSRWALGEENLFNADRTVLRSVLLSGLEEHVEFGKRFERYEGKPHGEIVAHFTDGTSASGSLLVGADGIRSLVRKQLLPDFELLDTEGRAVFGKTVITNDLRQRMAPQIGKGITLTGLSGDNRIKLFCDGMSWSRESATHSARRLGIEIPADYIYWVLLFRKDVVPEDEERKLLSLSNEESAQLGARLSADWNDNLRVLFEMQTVDAASTLATLTAPSNFDSEWAKKPSDIRDRLVLMGDSAHPMPPVGGVGANTGFQDAAELLDAICHFETLQSDQDGERERLILAFEKGVLERAKAAVERSASGAGRFFGMKPLAELKPASK